MGSFLAQQFDIVVLFQGFEAFTRKNAIWSQPDMAWGFTLAPFVFIGLTFLLMVLSRIIAGRWSWDTPSLMKVDLANGIAPMLKPQPQQPSGWKRAISRILNAL